MNNNKNIKLSSYVDNLLEKYNTKYSNNCNKVINYLDEIIADDLYLIGDSKDVVVLYNNLKGWLLRFYPDELIKSFEKVNYDYNKYKKYMLFCFVITFFRNENIAHNLYDTLKLRKIVTRFLSYDDIKYELQTNEFGNITFYRVEEYFKNNQVILNKIKSMGNDIFDSCSECRT